MKVRGVHNTLLAIPLGILSEIARHLELGILGVPKYLAHSIRQIQIKIFRPQIETLLKEPSSYRGKREAKILPIQTSPQPQKVKYRSLNTLLDFSTASFNWKHWTPFIRGRLKTSGVLKSKLLNRKAGAIRHAIPVKPGAYYRLTIQAEVRGKCKVYWLVQDSNTFEPFQFKDEDLSPADATFRDDSPETAILYFQTYQTTDHLDIAIQMRKCGLNDALTVKKLTLEQVVEFRFEIPRPEMAAGERIILSMASIPGRKRIIEDTINSLHRQVDQINLYLNGYDSVPPFLENYDNIVVERSQEHGDRGDAGKFFWADDPTPGYRFTCDDDIIYPPNYVYHVVQELRRYSHKAILSAHGILLKQPVCNYYSKQRGYTYHFRHANPSAALCHILGTGVMAYHTSTVSLSPTDFPVPNMADIWLAKKAQEEQIPLVCYAHPADWIAPRTLSDGQSIFKHSQQNYRGKMNTASVQTEVLQSIAPLTVKPLPHGQHSKKRLIAIHTFNRLRFLQDCLYSFLNTCDPSTEWVVIIADGGSSDGTLGFLEGLSIPYELHIVQTEQASDARPRESIISVALQIKFDVGFIANDAMIFDLFEWEHLYEGAIETGKYGISTNSLFDITPNILSELREMNRT